MSRLVLLDNEAVQALGDTSHPKHRRVLSHAQVTADRKRRSVQITLGVPTTVRVEAGWDRRQATWAFLNQLRISDLPLDSTQADSAAVIRVETGVSVADAHLGAVIASTPTGDITVLTSDPGDVRTVAGTRPVTVIRI